MATHCSPLEPFPVKNALFATTHWSIVVSAGEGRSSESRRALASLCENYWFPLYAFVRRKGYSAPDAQDLTQEFFVRLLAKNYVAVADPQRGKFRSFLLGAMKHFLANQERRKNAEKRGGHRLTISLDFDSGENRYGRIEPADPLTPERLYEKRWTLTLLDLVLSRLRGEFCKDDKSDVFDALAPFLVGETTQSYAEMGRELGMMEGAVKVAVHRLRRRYRKLLKEEIAQTIDDSESLEDELRELLAAVSAK